MTDRDHKDISEDKSSQSQENADRLSKDEKMAFEKIMAEIGDEDTAGSSRSDEDQADDNGDKSTPEEKITGGADDQQSSSGDAMADMSGDNETADLNDEQQAALDRIMAEINGENKTETPEPEPDKIEPEPQAESDKLNDEQQAALDKIMAEINGENKTETPEPEPDKIEPEPQAESDKLDDEQQAALDKIMAEINGENKTETPEPEPDKIEPEPQAESDKLDDEQQAALDKIMAEINGDGDVQTPSPASGADHNDDIFSAEDGPGENAAEEEEASPKQANLSIEEFDDELNNLLSAANTQVEASESESALASKEKPKTKTDNWNASVTLSEIKAALSDSDKAQQEGLKDPGKPPPSASESDSEYAILHEITPSETPNSAKLRQKVKLKGGKRKPRNGRKMVRYATAALVLFSMAGAGYGYYAFRTKAASPALLAPEATLVDPVAPTGSQIPQTQIPQTQIPQTQIPQTQIPQTQIPLISEPENQAPLTPLQPAAAMSVPLSESPAMPTFVSLKENIASTRQHILNKIEEIRELKAYYQNGVKDEQKKIMAALHGKTLPPLEAALKERQIELGLLAIQRRKVYTTKLDAPIKLLTSSSEELLYLERKTRLFETLNQGVSGLAIAEFTQEVAEIIANHVKASNALSVDDIHVKPPSLDALWAELKSENTGSHETPEASPADRALDQQITEEICAGRFERKYLLSELTPESAQCLAKWTGKDLYLNSLTDLPPSVAKIVSQWQGEWLSLNGIKALSADSAKYLAQWKGKRLSLNGLTRLSQRATSHLSKWKGEQLEMVGLEKIGRWENYGTRLYLSERLRRKLHVQ